MHVLNRLLERETGPTAISAGRRLLELDPLGEIASNLPVMNSSG